MTSSAGMVVNFSFGDPSQLPPVREAIDVTPVSKLIPQEETVVDVNMFNEVVNESER